jgi:hypothetical protein
MSKYDSAKVEGVSAWILVMTIGLGNILVLLNLGGLVVQTAELPLGKSDAGLLVDGLHQGW